MDVGGLLLGLGLLCVRGNAFVELRRCKTVMNYEIGGVTSAKVPCLRVESEKDKER